MIKQAEIRKRQQLYFACRAVLRTKYGSHAVPPTDRFMKKQAVINPIGIATGALTGGTAGYSGGKWLAGKLGLEENDWRAKALRWGGGALGAVAGGTIGNFAGPLAGKLLGWGGRALGGAAKLLGWGSKATKAVSMASKATKAVNATQKATSFGSKLMNGAKSLGDKALKAVKNPKNWQKGFDYLSDMMDTGYNDNVQPPEPQQQIYTNPNEGGQYNPTGNLAGTNIPVVPQQMPQQMPQYSLQDMMSQYQQQMQATA